MKDFDEIAAKVRAIAVEHADDSKFYHLAMQVYFLTLAVRDAKLDEFDARKTVSQQSDGQEKKA